MSLSFNRGAYGVVRRVIDKNSGNQYAAKFLRYPDHLVKSELETELEMLTLLDHTGIVQVIDGYEDKKRLVIVMEMYPSARRTLHGHDSALCFSADPVSVQQHDSPLLTTRSIISSNQKHDLSCGNKINKVLRRPKDCWRRLVESKSSRGRQGRL